MTRLLVIGETGQVAVGLARAAAGQGLSDIAFAGRDRLDLATPGVADPVIAAAAPEVVINAAAYTAVDQAEEEEALATRCNGAAVGEIAAAAASVGAALIHLSTDYVYPGTRPGGGTPDGLHLETDPVDPVNAYGRSKLAGERAALEANPRTVILRTAWVYAPWGRNFVLTMLRLADRGRLTVVEDQHGQPTSAIDIAEACLAIAPRLAAVGPEAGLWGVYHYAGRGPTTWAGLAREVFRQGRSLGLVGTVPEVAGIPTAAYPTPAARPANSTLDCTRFETTFGRATVPWQEALARVLRLRAEAA